jgi:hypothetical protein
MIEAIVVLIAACLRPEMLAVLAAVWLLGPDGVLALLVGITIVIWAMTIGWHSLEGWRRPAGRAK